MDLDFSLNREGPGTYKQRQLRGWAGPMSSQKFLTLCIPWLAGLSSVPAKTTAFVLQKYEECRIRKEMTSLMRSGLHPPFSMGGDSCRVNDCKFPASRCGLDMISDLIGLLLLTSLAFFHLSFSFTHPIFQFSQYFLSHPWVLLSAKNKKGELRIILLTLLG